MYKFRLKTLKVLFSVLLISSIITGSIFSVSLPAAAASPIKIMPVGDSCTEGMGGGNMGSYRTDLYKLLTNAGISFDFVGSNKGGPSDLPDKDNEGHSGWTIPQIASNIDNWIRTQNPDVILLWIGGNDVFMGGGPNPTGLGNLIDQIFRDKPSITLFVSDYYPWPDSVKAYNALIPGIVQEKAAAGKNVHFVKLSEIDWNKSTDLSGDNLHLSAGGYTKIANIWYKYIIDTLKSMSANTDEGDFRITSEFNRPMLEPNQMISTKITFQNISAEPYTGNKNVLLIVALFDKNNSMVNISYISKGVPYQGGGTLTAGFKLPSDISGYKAKAFVWEGVDIQTSSMIPISNVVELH